MSNLPEMSTKMETLHNAVEEFVDFVGQDGLIQAMGAEAVTLTYVRALQQIADSLDAFSFSDLAAVTPEEQELITRAVEMLGRSLFVQQYAMAALLGAKRPARHVLHQTFTNEFISRIREQVAEC